MKTMPDWVERLLEEEKQLSERIKKLCTFVSSGAPKLTKDDLTLLRRQRDAMLLYHDIIVDRLLKLQDSNYVKLDPGNADRV